jgi:hypothetical protein
MNKLVYKVGVYQKINDNIKNSGFEGIINTYLIEISLMINKSGLDAVPPLKV